MKEINEEILKENDGKKFDVVLMNPPFESPQQAKSHGDQLYVKFINKVLDISKKGVLITPSNAFISKVKTKNKELKENINKYKPELIIDEWQNYGFDISAKSKLCISVWNTVNSPDKIKINDEEFDSQEDIVLNTSKYLKEFYNKLTKYFETYDSMYDHCVANPKNGQFFDKYGKAKLKEKWNNKETWFVYMPYCNASYLSTFGYEKYNDKLWNGPARILIPFDKEEQAINCFKTICNSEKRGDLSIFFSLICNILCSTGYILWAKKYMYFPWLDFSKSYTDEELFKIIGMEYNKEEIDKIKKK